MKKALLSIMVALTVITSVIAADTNLNIIKHNDTVLSFPVSNLDSVQMDVPNSQILIHQKDGNIISIKLTDIDRMTYSSGPSYTRPTVSTVDAEYVYKVGNAICEAEITDDGGTAILDRGVCWSTSQAPTISDNNNSDGQNIGRFYASTTALSIGETYYVRAYATNSVGTAYGTAVKVIALMGNVTYNLDLDKTQYPEYYKLITTALDSACYYYNRYTEFKANIHVYYNAGIPTAQASYHGSIGFGPNTGYMWVGTTMHEMAHFFGSGTSNGYWNNMIDGVWQGPVAQPLCQQLTGSELHGDKTHYWPSGINYRNEVKSATDLINHAKIIQAMLVEDGGLPTNF